jgi:hypothetical protein
VAEKAKKDLSAYTETVVSVDGLGLGGADVERPSLRLSRVELELEDRGAGAPGRETLAKAQVDPLGLQAAVHDHAGALRWRRAAGRVGNGGNVEGYHAGTGATASLSARGSAVQPDFSQLETFAAAKRALFVVLAHFRECKQTLLGRLYIARDNALGQLAADEMRA